MCKKISITYNAVVNHLLMWFNNVLKIIIMAGNTKYFNKWLYFQRYYDFYNEVYFWRVWLLGFYFDTNKNSL